MEVWVGPTSLGIEVSSSSPPAAGVRDCKDKHGRVVEQGLFPPVIGVGELAAERGVVGFGLGMGRSEKVGVGFGSESDSESSSSIGCPSGDDDDEEDVSVVDDGESDEVESKFGAGRLGSLGSLVSLEDSLPIKRGLSNHYTGKSKSFANLSDVSGVNDLVKQESPFNKRRRTLNACKWARKSSFYSWSNPKSMPLLALGEEDDDTEEQEEKGQEKQEEMPKVHDKKFRSFKSPSCFSLADIQGQHA